MKKSPEDEQASAARRDAVLRRMLETPKPSKPKREDVEPGTKSQAGSPECAASKPGKRAPSDAGS